MAIFERGDSYRISVYKGIINGKKCYHWETFKGNSKQARDRETQIKHELLTGTYTKPVKTTLGAYLDTWLQDYSKPNMSPRTHEVYTQIAENHLKPNMGNTPLTSLTKPEIAHYYSGRLEIGLAAQTVVHHHKLLHKALETAIEWGYITRNPSDRITLPKIQKPEMHVWDPEEVHIFLEAAKASEYYALFHTALFTGMSRSELLALRWKDVDMIFNQISVNRSMHQRKDKEYEYRQTKTAKRNRLIAMVPSNALVLTDYYDRCKKISKELSTTFNDDTLVFCHLDTGEPVRPNTVTRAWSEIAKIAKVKHIRFHDARHTHATILLKMGIHPKIVQERLGHSTISVTLDIYSHVTPTMQQAAAKSFDDAFKFAYNKTEDKK